MSDVVMAFFVMTGILEKLLHSMRGKIIEKSNVKKVDVHLIPLRFGYCLLLLLSVSDLI